MEFSKVVENRYSCKKFSNREVEKEKIVEILEAGRLAPTAKNLQEQHVYVIQSQKYLEIIDKHTPCRYGAPVVLLVAYDKNNVFTYPAERINSGIEDACSDDALWLVASIVEYIKETGEIEFADEIVTYADGGEGTVYEHMMRILDFSAEQVGATGICKGLRADWNDCLNLMKYIRQYA